MTALHRRFARNARDRAPFGQSHRAVLLVIAFMYSTVGISAGAVPVAVASRGGSTTEVGAAMGSYAFTAVAARVACGVVMQSVGYRPCLFVAACLLILGEAGSTVAQPALLTGARLILGAGIGILLAAGTGWLVDIPMRSNGVATMLGSIGTVNYTVLALGAPFGGWLAQATTPTTALWLAAAPPLLAVALLLAMKEPPTPGAGSYTPTLAIETSSNAVTHRVGAGLALAAVGNPVVVAFGVKLGTERHLAGGAAAVFVYGSALVAARALLGSLTERMSKPTPLASILVLEAASIATLATTKNSAVFLTAVATDGAAMAFTYPLCGAQLAEFVGPASRSRALSLLGAYVNLGIGFGAIAIGAIATRTSLEAALLLSAGGVASGAAIIAVTLTRLAPPSGRESDL